MSRATLVVGSSWVGDMVMAHSLFQTLRQHDPEAAIDVLAPAWSRPLLARMPEVRAAIDMPLGHGRLGLLTRHRIGRALCAEGYVRAIVLPGSLKSALIPFFARIPTRTGYRGEWRYGLINDMRSLDRVRLPMVVQRFTALAMPADAPLPPPIARPGLAVDPAARERALRQFGLNVGAQPVLSLCPGAEYGPAKRWPAAHFADTARSKLDAGWQVWLFGSDKDRALADIIDERVDHRCVNLAGRTSLGEAIDLLSLSRVVVSNDSGLMHVASALDRAVVAVFGPTDPVFAPPLTDTAELLRLELPCSPCARRVCPLGHTRCLNDLRPQQVIAAIDRLSGEVR